MVPYKAHHVITIATIHFRLHSLDEELETLKKQVEELYPCSYRFYQLNLYTVYLECPHNVVMHLRSVIFKHIRVVAKHLVLSGAQISSAFWSTNILFEKCCIPIHVQSAGSLFYGFCLWSSPSKPHIIIVFAMLVAFMLILRTTFTSFLDSHPDVKKTSGFMMKLRKPGKKMWVTLCVKSVSILFVIIYIVCKIFTNVWQC